MNKLPLYDSSTLYDELFDKHKKSKQFSKVNYTKYNNERKQKKPTIPPYNIGKLYPQL